MVCRFDMINDGCNAENEREFDYSEKGEKGPAHWGDMKEEWRHCKMGNMQSPIDMSSDRVQIVVKSGEIKRRYTPSNATLKNRGHDISVRSNLLHHHFIYHQPHLGTHLGLSLV